MSFRVCLVSQDLTSLRRSTQPTGLGYFFTVSQPRYSRAGRVFAWVFLHGLQPGFPPVTGKGHRTSPRNYRIKKLIHINRTGSNAKTFRPRYSKPGRFGLQPNRTSPRNYRIKKLIFINRTGSEAAPLWCRNQSLYFYTRSAPPVSKQYFWAGAVGV